MEEIKEVTDLLLKGTITKDEADKFLLDLFVVVHSWDTKTCSRCGRDLYIECPTCDKEII